MAAPRTRKKSKPKCDPKYAGKRIEVEATKFGNELMLKGFLGGKPVAELELDCSSKDLCVVKWTRVGHVQAAGRVGAGVDTTGLLGCGIGTQMYEAAWEVACGQQRRLASDRSRSDAAEGFWSKQKKKGRARCVSDAQGGNRFDFDLWNKVHEFEQVIDERVDSGSISYEEGERRIREYREKMDQKGARACARYEVATACPRSTDGSSPYSLKGLGRPRIRVRTVTRRPKPMLTARNSVTIEGGPRRRRRFKRR